MIEAPWVIVAGGFHQRGGMDKANAALANHLIAAGVPVHLVAHTVDEKYCGEPLAKLHIVSRPADSFFLGEKKLAAMGLRVARTVTGEHVGARVVVNGGNCAWPDVNWVHSVHHAWPCADDNAPMWFKTKNRLVKGAARRNETRAIGCARVVLANSDRTRRDVIDHRLADSEKVHTVYLGSDPTWRETSAVERCAAKRWLEIPEGRPVAVFVGALSHDDNKGMDTLLRAWRTLCGDTIWDVALVVAGGGNGLPAWQALVTREGLAGRVRFLGHTDRVGEVLAAADLLISPVRYEAYGLNVQEAVCRGVPAIVSQSAGVAEQYPSELQVMLLTDPTDAGELVRCLQRWRQDPGAWRALVRPTADRLRAHTWDDMARRIVTIASATQDESLGRERR